MATADTAPRAQDRHNRLRPFAWMKRLANLKNSSSDSNGSSTKKINGLAPTKSKKSAFKRKDPYGLSPTASNQKRVGLDNRVDSIKYKDPEPRSSGSFTSMPITDENQNPPESNRSAAATLDTNPETIHSEGGGSKTGTSHTVGGGMSSISGGGNSIFSSSNHSSRSLTTTLTTIQSNTPAGFSNHTHPDSAGTQAGLMPQQASTSPSSAYFTHQYPTTPASAVPAHLTPNPSHVPTTYRSAIANNLLSDNASILTLASSSNRRHRRNSLDTNASVRAIAPSSVWGGSRESLPLSVLSHTAESSVSVATPTASQSTSPGTANTTIYSSQQQQRPSIGGVASAERASVYSSSGVAAPVLSSERNSIYAGKTGREQGDGTNSSIRGGHLGHGRNDSTTGSIGAVTIGSVGGGTAGTGVGSSSYATPKEQTTPTYGGRLSRRSSDWKEGGLERDMDDEEEVEEEKQEREDDQNDRASVDGERSSGSSI